MLTDIRGSGIVGPVKPLSLKRARTRLGLTQVELEAASGVDQSVISRLERGSVTRPEFSTVIKLAKALGVDPVRLKFGESSEAVAR